MGSTGQRSEDTETARPLVRPPLLHLACLVLGLVLDRVLPLPLTLGGRRRSDPARNGDLRRGCSQLLSRRDTGSHTARANTGDKRHSWLKPQSNLRWDVAPLRRDRRGRAEPMGSCPRAASHLRHALRVVAREEVYLERRFGGAYREYKARAAV